jgi:hypothetical protein
LRAQRPTAHILRQSRHVRRAMDECDIAPFAVEG